jgi:alpha-N-arabinofuranosidase
MDVRDPDTGAVTVFAVNRSISDAIPLRVEFKGDQDVRMIEAIRLHDQDPNATNTAGDPNRVMPRSIDDVILDRASLTSTLPPFSWNVYRLASVS